MARAPLWPPEADAWLSAVSLGSPLPTVTQHYNKEAQRHGWPLRTQRAVEQRWRFLSPRARGTAKRQPVYCPATNRRWPSIAAAAADHGRTPPTLEEAFQKHGRWGSLVPCEAGPTPEKR